MEELTDYTVFKMNCAFKEIIHNLQKHRVIQTGGEKVSRLITIENEFATLWYYPEKRIIHHQFHKFAYGEDFRNILTTGAELLEKYRCTKWLSDDRNIGILHPEDRAWGDEHWTPRVVKAGWRYWAFLMPERATGKLSSTNLAETFSELGVTVKAVDSEEEGMAWLEEQK